MDTGDEKVVLFPTVTDVGEVTVIHLAVAIGLTACALGYRTQFATAARLATTLTRAHHENRLEEKLKQLEGQTCSRDIGAVASGP